MWPDWGLTPWSACYRLLLYSKQNQQIRPHSKLNTRLKGYSIESKTIVLNPTLEIRNSSASWLRTWLDSSEEMHRVSVGHILHAISLNHMSRADAKHSQLQSTLLTSEVSRTVFQFSDTFQFSLVWSDKVYRHLESFIQKLDNFSGTLWKNYIFLGWGFSTSRSIAFCFPRQSWCCEYATTVSFLALQFYPKSPEVESELLLNSFLRDSDISMSAPLGPEELSKRCRLLT